MVEENISQEFRLKKIDERRDYFKEQINQNEVILDVFEFTLLLLWLFFL